MFLGMGPLELVIIVVIVLIIFGPKNLPKIGSALGKTVKNVREGMEEGKEEIGEKSESSDEPVEVVQDEDDADAPVTPADADGQYCPKCGAHNATGASFCAKCGAKLGSDN
ncbi:zinc ribbon domain-containing protein [Olsenella sp. An290]|uniref:twin-arginine translocase TatA/TatE family subunit n=1 Tax=Olsenella sp. An290 TaxID=1965625 RepID=UPI000B3670DE|nr:zinc ribbon domain-containing protein [Olsenella sp. An290]OUO35772.1 twin-arginine translocase TatA/TatE family subunit [Olsenella sp. An290]